MKKVLLSLAVLGTATAANAQLLNYGFEEGQTAQIDSTNWGAYPTSTVDFKAEMPYEGSYALGVSTDATCNNWERVVAFKGLDIQPEKSYRVKMKVWSNTTMNVGILEGDWYQDKALQAGNGDTGVDQVYDATFDGSGFQSYSHCFWSPSYETMTKFYSNTTYPELLKQYFLRLSFKGIGYYYVDNIVVEESAINGVRYNGDAIVIDFGYETNAKELASAAGGTAVLPAECVSVLVDGEVAAVESVEIKSDGTFAIFVNSDDYLLTDENVVTVSFTNTVGLVYSTNVAPECFTNPNAPVYAFEAETAEYDESIALSSLAYEEAELVSSNPADESFELDEDITTFTFTFNKPVLTNFDGDYATAVLQGGNVNESLVIVDSEEANATLTFTRPEGATPLVKGVYTVTVENVYNEKGVAKGTADVITFEVGKVQVAQVTYNDLFTTLLSGAYGSQPAGWSIMVGGESWTGGEPKADNGSACRNLNVTGSDGVEYTAFYLCDRDGYTYMMYGDQEDARLTLPAGDLEFSVIALSHDATGHSLEYRLEDMEGNEVASTNGSCAVVANTEFTAINAADAIPVQFHNDAEGNFVLKVHALGGGYTAVRVLGFKVRSYEMSAGETSESEVLINESFADVSNGYVPAAGTGWSVYDNNVLGAKGQAQSGRNRMMNTGSCTNLSIGFYNRCFGSPEAYYMTYGEPAPEGQEVAEPEFILDNVKYSFSWYAVNWKGDSQTYYFQLINAETGEVEYEMTPVVVTANVNGGTQSAEAVQISFNYIPVGGKYIMKWWMTGESIVGKIRVEKMGSLAVYWKNKLINDGLNPAKEEREKSDADEFAGTTRTNLDNVIAKNTNPDYHTPAEYQAGIDECLAAAKAMAARRVAIAAYKSDIVKLASALESVAGTKYENLEIVPGLQELYSTYANVDPSTLEDEVLLPVQAEITKGASMVSSVVEVIDKLLTKQIANLLTSISVYADDLENEVIAGWIAKGENALTDDQEVAAQLQKILTACIYKKIANGYDFNIFEEEYELSYPDSLDVTGYVANNMMYTVNAQKTYEGSAANAAFPGWDITEGTVSNVWWWESTLAISESKPAIDASIRNVGSNAFKVNQVLKNLPVGTYTMSMKTADCSNIKDVSQTYVKKNEDLPWCNSFVYAVSGDTVKMEANYGEGQVWRNAAATVMTGIKTEIPAGAYTVDMVIGADMNCTGDAAQVDDTYLYMTGKLAGFDYAAAAEAILATVPSGIELQKRDDAPVAVTYFNLNGQQSVATQGVNIKVERYADGYTVVKKVVIK